MRIRTKIAFLVTTLMAVVITAIAGNLIWVEQRKVIGQSSARIDALMEGMMRIARESLSSNDELMLLSYLKFLMRDYPEMELALVSRQGHSSVIGEVRSSLFYRTLTISDPQAAAFRLSDAIADKPLGRVSSQDFPPQTISIQIGFSKTQVERQIRRAQKSLVGRVLAIAGLGLLLGLAGSLWVSRHLAMPVSQMAAAAEMLGRGNLDVTVPEQGQDELADLARQFNTMANKLRETISFKEDLFSTLSHELNNPLSGLKGFLAYLVEMPADQNPEERAQAYQTMSRAVTQMEVSLNNALQLFKAGADPILRRESLDLVEIVGEAVRLFAHTAQANQIDLRGPRLTGRIELMADRELIRRVIINLVSNAIKYTPEKGKVEVGLDEDWKNAHITVSDNGPGISPENRDKIFTKFYRIQEGRNKRIPGTGLGLAIAKKAVDLHQGRIWVESVVGVGSIFHVLIPKFAEAQLEQAHE